MLGVGCVLIFLALRFKFEPLILLPMGIGTLLANFPATGLTDAPSDGNVGGLYWYFKEVGLNTEVFPILIFLGLGALTDFSPLIANPITFLLGAAAQFGIYFAMLVAILIGFSIKEAGAIGIIGSADGPTTIYVSTQLAPHLVGSVAVAAYSYMAMVPLIQPPIMRLLTTKEERLTRMAYNPRPVSRLTLIIFPLVVMGITALVTPKAIPLVGVFMFGNLLRVSGVVERLSNTAQNELMNIVTIFLSSTVGSTMVAATFLTWKTLGILTLGLIAFASATAGGVLFGKVMYRLSGRKINPLIGAAGVSAVPMSARVAQRVAHEVDPTNYILMHAMGPNVAGVIGSAIAGGVLLAMLK
ncbi:MAG: sodium ion-translocating decarboxylase subunit beta [Chloroflexi bacterium]|nr:sodium ion-translocating decarboxylase subunit beta [Chloroflexota bacterium]